MFTIVKIYKYKFLTGVRRRNVYDARRASYNITDGYLLVFKFQSQTLWLRLAYIVSLTVLSSSTLHSDGGR